MTHFTTTYAEFMSTFHDRITRYVAACPVAVSGEHGHDTTLKLAIALVHGFDLSPDMAWEFIQAWNQKCMPPWSERDLRRKLNEAEKLTPKHGKQRGYLL
jgi:hypothetical protein